MYAEVKALHSKIYPELLDLRDYHYENSTAETCVDAAYVLKQISKLLNDIRKETDKVAHVIERIGCLIRAEEMSIEPLVGQFCTGRVDITHISALPAVTKDPDQYMAFMNDLGVPDDLVEGDLVRPHWPAMQEALSERIKAGTPLPVGITGEILYAKYALRCRKSKEVDLDALAAEMETRDGEEK